MPTLSRKRRRNIVEDEGDDEFNDTPEPQPRSNRTNRRSMAATDNDANEDDDNDIIEEADAAADSDSPRSDSNEPIADTDDSQSANAQLVKNLVRLALASEYCRTPIRRQDISAKVLAGRSRDFRAVFGAAQLVLRRTFGMELVELPVRERVTLKERRAATQGAASASANASGAGAAGTKAWILQSVLPGKFVTPDVIPPGRCPTVQLESAYVGLYSFVVAVIMLNGGVLGDAKLDRYLRRVNAETSTPVEKTEKLLQRMIREGYIVRVKENVGGDEVVEYMVGTRGKVEIGEKGIEGLVRRVYGNGNGSEEEDAELQKRIERSLRVGMARTQANQPAEDVEGE